MENVPLDVENIILSFLDKEFFIIYSFVCKRWYKKLKQMASWKDMKSNYFPPEYALKTQQFSYVIPLIMSFGVTKKIWVDSILLEQENIVQYICDRIDINGYNIRDVEKVIKNTNIIRILLIKGYGRNNEAFLQDILNQKGNIKLFKEIWSLFRFSFCFILEFIIIYNRFDIIKYLYKLDKQELIKYICLYSAKYGNLEIFMWGRSNGGRISFSEINAAIDGDHLNIIKKLYYYYGVEWTNDHINYALCKQRNDIIEFMNKTRQN